MQTADIARCAQVRPGSQSRANRRSRRADLDFHARHELESYQGAGRWNRCQRSEQSKRGIRFRPVSDPGHPKSRGSARSAERTVRLRCHRRRDQYHYQERLRSRAVQPRASKAAPSIPSTRMPASAAQPIDFTTAPTSSISIPARHPSRRWTLLLPGEQRIDDYYDNLTGSTKLGYDLTDTLRFGARRALHRHALADSRETTKITSRIPFPTRCRAPTTPRSSTRASSRTTLAFDGVLDQTFGVAYGNIKSTLWSPDNGPGEQCRRAAPKSDWQGSIQLAADQHLILGLEHERDAISQPISASTTINSGYGELQSKFGDRFFRHSESAL